MSDPKSENKIRSNTIERCAEILEINLPIKINALKKQYKNGKKVSP